MFAAHFVLTDIGERLGALTQGRGGLEASRKSCAMCEGSTGNNVHPSTLVPVSAPTGFIYLKIRANHQWTCSYCFMVKCKHVSQRHPFTFEKLFTFLLALFFTHGKPDTIAEPEILP